MDLEDGTIFTPRITRAVKRGHNSGTAPRFEGCFRFAGLGQRVSQRLQIHVVNSGTLTRHPVMVHGVRPIGGDVHFEDASSP